MVFSFQLLFLLKSVFSVMSVILFNYKATSVTKHILPYTHISNALVSHY